MRNSKHPLISVVIPTYNAEKTFPNCLESISNQTYKKFEILIVDGLSKDNTLKLAEEFRGKFPSTVIVSEADKGIYDAMNKGINLAKGEWIYFMGSDDAFYGKNTLETFVSEISPDDEIIYGDVFSSRFEGTYDGEFNYLKLADRNICHQAIFFKRNIFKKIGKFDLRYKAHSDWDHNIRWFFSKKITKKYMNEIIANYADGGFSSVHEDKIFEKKKKDKIFYSGLGKVPISKLVAYYTSWPRGQNIFINFLIKIYLLLEWAKKY